MLLADLSAGQKAAIAGMGAAFIVFALVSSFLIPRYRPNFPDRRVGAYVAVSFGFLVAMMAVIVFAAREKTEARAEGPTTTPTQTTPGPTRPPVPKGDAAAGKELFVKQGCGQCHTFKPAGSKGGVGPDLDNLAADAKKANRGSVEQYAFESIKSPNAYIVPGFQRGIMPPFGQTLMAKQIADLVAYLTHPS